MLTDRPEQAADEGHAVANCTALVPLTPTLQWAYKLPLPRPDPSFVTQLIASAEHVAQASRLRRATPADARTAYGSKRLPNEVGLKTRQLI